MAQTEAALAGLAAPPELVLWPENLLTTPLETDPELEAALTAGVVGRAREAGTIAVTTVNPRDFTHDRHRTVDDTPYGGGPGMVMKAEPLLAAIAAAATAAVPAAHRILLSPAGRPLTQAKVRELAASLS